MINLKPIPNVMKPLSGRRIGLLSEWPEITYLAKLISDIFQSIDRGHDPRHGIWNEPICLVTLSAYICIYSKAEDYETENKLHIDTEYETVHRHQKRTRENGGSLDFNFISLPSPAVDKNWGLPMYRLLHSLPLENYAAYNWNLLWMAFSLNVSTFLCTVTG